MTALTSTPVMRDKLTDEVEEAWNRVEKTATAFQTSHGGSHPYLTHELIDSVVNERMPVINAWSSVQRQRGTTVGEHINAICSICSWWLICVLRENKVPANGKVLSPIHTRHFNKGNVVFLDGHAAAQTTDYALWEMGLFGKTPKISGIHCG